MANIPMLDQLQGYLSLTTQRQQMVVQNMANVDTPGYRTQGFSFEHELSQALGASASTQTAVDVTSVDGLTSRPDGNNVSMDREGMQLAKAQLEFRAGIALLKSENSRVMNAIHADSK